MTLRRGHLQHGDKVEIYRNLHNDTFSVRRNGKVVRHVPNHEELYLQDAKFAVQPAGQARVLHEGKKNVHAYIRGTVVDGCRHDYTQEVYYNPYKFNSFVTQAWSKNPCAIYNANRVTLKQGKVYVAI